MRRSNTIERLAFENKIRFTLRFVHHQNRTGKPFGFFMSAGDGLRPERPCAFPNPRADAIGPRQQSLFRRKAPYESPHLHQSKPKTNSFCENSFRFFIIADADRLLQILFLHNFGVIPKMPTMYK